MGISRMQEFMIQLDPPFLKLLFLYLMQYFTGIIYLKLEKDLVLATKIPSH